MEDTNTVGKEMSVDEGAGAFLKPADNNQTPDVFVNPSPDAPMKRGKQPQVFK